MNEPAPTATAAGAAERLGRREPWSPPRLTRLDAGATAAGGIVITDGADTSSS